METNQIISYIAETSNFKRQLSELERVNSTIANKFGKDFTRATDVINRRLDILSSKRIRLDGGETVNRTVQRLTSSIRLADGSAKTLVQTFEKTGNSVKTLNTSLKDGAVNSKTFGQNLGTLVKRAAITIPVWFALRNSIRGVFSVIRDGLKSLVDFDRALSKARNNLSGTSDEIERNFGTLKSTVVDLSIATGESVETITNAFQKFATVGLDFETSLSGATEATKLAVTLFGDAEQNANALARAFRLLEDTSEGARPPAEQLQVIVAQLADLWRDNAFEINEFSGALEKFAPTARQAGLSASEVVATLSAIQTAGIRGGSAGRLLGTAFLQLDKNFSKISSTLGLELDPALTTSFERFQAVLTEIEKLNEIDQIGASQAVQELFGGVRGTRLVQALVGLRSQLDSNLARTGDIEQFNKTFEDTASQLNRQLDILKQVRLELGRSFVIGITGGDDFNDSIEILNKSLLSLVPTVQTLGESIRTTFNTITIPARVASRIIPINSVREALSNLKRISAENSSALSQDITNAFQGAFNEQEVSEIADRFWRAFQTNRTPLSISVFKELKKLENDLKSGNVSQLELQVNARRIQEQVEKGVTDANNSSKTADLSEDLEASFQTQQSVQSEILRSELERLRTTGALNSEVIKAEIAIRKQLGLKEEELDVLKRQLELEKALKNERRLGGNLSSETVELFKIAQEEGTSIARTIGNVLSGDLNFDAFVASGSRAVDIFRERFGSLFENRQAESFFTRGRGQGIDIAEEGLRRGGVDSGAIAEQIRQRAIEDASRASAPAVSQTNNVTNNINITQADVNEFAEKTIQVILEKLDNTSSDISKKLSTFIENF